MVWRLTMNLQRRRKIKNDELMSIVCQFHCKQRYRTCEDIEKVKETELKTELLLLRDGLIWRRIEEPRRCLFSRWTSWFQGTLWVVEELWLWLLRPWTQPPRRGIRNQSRNLIWKNWKIILTHGRSWDSKCYKHFKVKSNKNILKTNISLDFACDKDLDQEKYI